MTSLVLILHRARAGLGLLLTIAALVTTTAAILAGTVGYSRAAATVAARDALSGADDPTEAGLRVRTRQLPDAVAQDARADDVIAEAFAPAPVLVLRTLASEPRPIADRHEKMQMVAGASLQPRDKDFSTIVEITGGQWPRSEEAITQGALHIGAAERLGLKIGDRLDVGGQEVEVTATWRPVDPDDPLWFGDPLAAIGAEEDVVGPLMVSPEEISRFSDTPFVQWIVLPDADQLLPRDLDALADAATTLKPQLDTDEIASRGITVEGDLAPTAARAAQNLDTARALNVVPLILLFSVCVIAVLQLARLLAVARAGELQTFLARGASRRQVLGWTLVEMVTVTVSGTVLGIAVALAVLATVPAGVPQTSLVVGLGALCGLAVLLALFLVTVVQVRHIAALGTSDRSGRARTVATASTVVLVLAAAALAWWQLRRYGSPLVTGAGGGSETDLLAGAAPTLLLGAVAVTAVALLGPMATSTELVLDRTNYALAHLTAAQVSRRLLAYAIPVVLLVLASGATTLSGLYAGTSADLRGRLSELGEGADVRATLAPRPDAGQGGKIATLPLIANAHGDSTDRAVSEDRDTGLSDADQSVRVKDAQALAPVWLGDTDIGDSEAELLSAPMVPWSTVAILPQGAADPAALKDLLAPQAMPDGRVELPEGARVDVDVSLDVDLGDNDLEALAEEIDSVTSFLDDEMAFPPREAREQALIDVLGIDNASSLDVSLLIQDRDSGVVQRVAAGSLAFGVQVRSGSEGAVDIEARPVKSTVSVKVPPGATFDVMGIDIDRMQLLLSVTTTIDAAVVVDGERQPQGAHAGVWQLAATPGQPPPRVAAGPDGGLRATETTADDLGRGGAGQTIQLRASPDLATAAGTGGEGDSRIPVALTRPLAETNNLQVGSSVDLETYGSQVSAEVVAVVEAVPGTMSPNVVLLDSEALSLGMLAQGETMPDPSEIWVSGSDPSALAEMVGQVSGIDSATAANPVPVTDAAAAVRLVFWVASAGALLLAATGVGAVAATLLKTRRAEVAVLRALGMTPGAQASSRAAELAGVVLAALMVGLLGGWLVGWVVVPELARSTTAPGQASLPAPLSLEVSPWLVLLTLALLIVVVILVVLARLVSAQATDLTYREDIR